jgi:hypothetical protein
MPMIEIDVEMISDSFSAFSKQGVFNRRNKRGFYYHSMFFSTAVNALVNNQ